VLPVPGHAYSLIRVKELSNRSKLVQVRNPWGREEWTGDWGDHSPLWTSALKAEVGHTIADDGSFWMSYKDFLKVFVSLSVGCFA
jgi:calpain-15